MIDERTYVVERLLEDDDDGVERWEVVGRQQAGWAEQALTLLLGTETKALTRFESVTLAGAATPGHYRVYEDKGYTSMQTFSVLCPRVLIIAEWKPEQQTEEVAA